VSIVLSSTVIRDTLPHQSDQIFGTGILMQCAPDHGVCGSLDATNLLVAQSRTCGIYVIGADVHITASVIREVLPSALDGDHGMGIIVRCSLEPESCGSFTASDTLITDTYNVGLVTAGSVTTLERVAITNTHPSMRADYADRFGKGLMVDRDWDLHVCGSLEMFGCLVDQSYAAGVAIHGTPSIIESSKIHRVAPQPADGAFGYGIQVEGLPGAPATVVRLRNSLIQDAQQAAILYSGATGSITRSVTRGGDFAVVWGGWPVPPDDLGGNQLEGNLVNGISRQDLIPSPAPPPITPPEL
jgi:hypothetical protein